MKSWVQVLALSVAVLTVIVIVVETVVAHAGRNGVEAKPRCYETPSAADVGRTLSPPVHAYGGLYVCGLYSRTALPDVIRCYELNEGCPP